MILLLAVAIGLAAGMLRARFGRRPYRAYALEAIGLVVLAVVPQLLAFHISSTAARIPNGVASAILVGSQFVLLGFVWLNRHKPGFWLLGLGLVLNLTAILLNGGWMPVAPEIVEQIASPGSHWQIGDRFGLSKDVLLTPETTRLWWLSDRFLFPESLGWRVAFSVGDVVLAAGVFWLLWSQGGARVEVND